MTQEKPNPSDLLKKSEESCQDCHPLTPLECTTRCNTWKLRNEFRKLHDKIGRPDFMKDLLNALKNKRRRQVLELISKETNSLDGLQQRMKETGYQQSKGTIDNQYVKPLIRVGLIEENYCRYRATLFGTMLNELTKDLGKAETILPPHSEGHEEAALAKLLNEHVTIKGLTGVIPAKSVPRVLRRLQNAGLARTNKERDYVYFFKTKRDSNDARLSPTERRIYGNIPTDGISAHKLALESEISLRRTYKYLRRLKGKKLVFARKLPKSYSLTAEGIRIARLLNDIHNLVAEALAAAKLVVNEPETDRVPTSDSFEIDSRRKASNFATMRRKTQN